MTFGAYALIGFVVLLLGALGLATKNARKAGGDSVLAKQSKAKDEARRDAQEAETRVDGMSDDELRERMRKRSQR